MSPFNVVQIIPELKSGGVERGTIDVANYLSNLKIHNHIISNGGFLEKELNYNFTNHLKLPVHSKNFLLFPKIASKIDKYIKEKNINLVHVRSRAPAWLVNILNKDKIKTISTFHNVYSGNFFLKKLYNQGLAKTDNIVAISNYVKSEIIKKYNISNKKITVINRGVDNVFFDGNVSNHDVKNFKEKFQIKKNLKIELFPGRLTEWKGQLEFIHIAKKLSKHNIFTYFVGDSKNTSYTKKLHKKIIENQLSENCKILGNLSQKDLKIMYFISSIIVSFPKRPEGFGRIISESLSMKKLVLAFNFGGVQDQLYNLDSIYKVDPLRYHNLDIKILDLINLNSEKVYNLKEIGRNHVNKYFSKKQMVEKYKNYYESLSI